MTIRVFHHKHLSDVSLELALDLPALKKDFAQYKESGIPPSNFGRDAEYDGKLTLSSVRQGRVSHVHLEDPENPWRERTGQFNRTSDIHLVYCRGFFDENAYLLMAVLSPDAHFQARNNTIMFKLWKMAEQFRGRH